MQVLVPKELSETGGRDRESGAGARIAGADEHGREPDAGAERAAEAGVRDNDPGVGAERAA